MKILFVSPAETDYLATTLLHGLRSLREVEVTDYPRYDVSYSDYPFDKRATVYGRGFTAFFGCEAVGCNRTQIDARIEKKEFDLIIIADIWSSWSWFAARAHALHRQPVIVIDGTDTPQVYPFAGLWWRHPSRWFVPRAHRKFLYFKREYTADSQFNLWHRLVARSWRSLVPAARNLRQISFSIPANKIVKSLPLKSKDFPRHIVDREVAACLPGSATTYAFATEAEYYADLQASRFGITTKRSGWDCLRHYEIAANGCVPCFRDLDKKPDTCAPHGLAPGVNCLNYSNSSELLKTIHALSADQYHELARGALQWASKNTTARRAQQVLESWKQDQLC